MTSEIYELEDCETDIKVVGIGRTGVRALDYIMQRPIQGHVEFIAIDKDPLSISETKAQKTILLDKKEETNTCGDFRIQITEQTKNQIADALCGAQMVVIIAGMGGSTGTWASPVIAEISQEISTLTVAVVTQPSSHEGEIRNKNAQAGMAELKNHVNAMLVIPKDKLECELVDDSTSIECSEKINEAIYNAYIGLVEVISRRSIIQVDFDDLCTVMYHQYATAQMGTAEAEGQDRATLATVKAIDCPLLEGILPNARGVMVHIKSSKDMRMSEIRQVLYTVKNSVNPDTNLIFGVTCEDSMENRIRVTIIAVSLD